MIKRVLVFLLALCTIAALASCNKTPEIEPTEPVVNTEDYTDTEPIETEPIELPNAGPEDETSAPDEPATEEPTSVEATGEGEATTEAAADPTTMNKTQLVQYYNDAVNLVRTGKPGYSKTEVLKVNDFKTSILGGAADSLISGVVKNAMPGNPETSSKKKGEDNVDHFMMDQQTSKVGVNDVSSISAKKEGANYVITLTVGSEVNPAKNGASKFSRVFQIQTRQEVLDSLAGHGLTGTVENTTLTYRDGKSVITVNEKGQIIKASTGFFVDADGKKMKIAILNPDIVAYQQSNWEYSNFNW